MKWQTKIDADGKLTVPAGVRSALRRNAGQLVTVTVETGRKRSNPQNAYYWSVVVPLMHQVFTGAGMQHSQQVTHEMLRAKFLEREQFDPTTGEVFRYSASTTSLNTQ